MAVGFRCGWIVPTKVGTYRGTDQSGAVVITRRH